MANASIATNSLGGQEPSEAPPPSHFRSTLPVPGASGTSNSIINPVSQSSTLLETVTGSSGEIKTWVSEYNFPAVLTRCKFPKEYDAIHELQTNKYDIYVYNTRNVNLSIVFDIRVIQKLIILCYCIGLRNV